MVFTIYFLRGSWLFDSNTCNPFASPILHFLSRLDICLLDNTTSQYLGVIAIICPLEATTCVWMCAGIPHPHVCTYFLREAD